MLQLNRSFLPFADLDAEAALPATHRVESWEELLKHPYVVILGEAGTGKSTEFKFQSRLMAANGLYSFFINISDLSIDFDKSLDIKDESSFEQWKDSTQAATFFLDSLDEAKLQSHTLRRALQNLRRALNKQWDRVRLVMSCRVSDWMAEADRDELRSVAPAGIEVCIVQLAPLNMEQVTLLARAAGITPVDDFLRAVNDNHAHIFIERPLDIQWLGAYWVQHKCIGSLRELIAYNVREKLKERNDRPATISATVANEGLRTLAGIAMLHNTLDFVVPETALDVHRTTGAIEAHDFLPDWSPGCVAELLRRPVFDEATYGRVRLHHRSVQEFLAACWISDLINNGFEHASVQEIFFRNEGSEQAIPTHLRPVAAWLALWDETFRLSLIKKAPSVLLEHGDPSGFSGEERRQILTSYAASYEGRAQRYDRFDTASLQRFSAPALSTHIEEMLKNPEVPDGLASLLLQIVDQGRISACADTCLKIASDLSRSSEVRSKAIYAAVESGTDAHQNSLLKLLDIKTEWDHDVAGAFVRSLYPDKLKICNLMRLLASVKYKPENMITGLQLFLEYDVSNLGPVELRLELLSELVGAIWQTNTENGERSVQPQQEWLLSSVAKLVTVLLDELPEAETEQAILLALDMFRWCNEHKTHIWSGLDDVKKALATKSKVRQVLFWRRVQAHHQLHRKIPKRYYDISTAYELLGLSCDDRDWLANDAQTLTTIQEQLLAFDALSTIPYNGEREQRFAYLASVAAGSDALAQRLKRMQDPLRLPTSYPKQRYFELQRESRAAKHTQNAAKTLDNLKKSIDKIKDGTDFNALCFLYRRSKSRDMSYGETTVTALEEEFGADIATAAVMGWRAFWRTYDPPMMHEREQRNEMPYAVSMGLAGLHFDFLDGLDASTLSRHDARLAVRYAGCEPNPFPTWLDAVATVYPEIVADALGPAATADMEHTEDKTLFFGVLSTLPQASDIIKRILLPNVVHQLRKREPNLVGALKYSLNFILSFDEIPVEELRTLSSTRCISALEDPKRFAVWWLVWLSCSHSDALDFIEQATPRLTAEMADNLVLEVCQRIYEYKEMYRVHELPARQQPKVLQRLILLVHKYIRPKEDINYTGAHWLDLRDNAQNVRSNLLSWLQGISTYEAVVVLRELAEDPLLTDMRDWLLRLAEQRVIANTANSESDIVDVLVKICKEHGTNTKSKLGDLVRRNKMIKILFMASNPSESDPLALGDEFREIEQKLRESPTRDLFNLSSQWAVRPSDLHRILMNENPTIVQFSGHGDGDNGLVFQSDDPTSQAMVTAGPLRNLFRLLKGNIRVVVLNACYSEAQAEQIVNEIDFVIGMSAKIGDKSARVFTTAFYRALTFRMSVQKAFDLGINELQLHNLSKYEYVPVLLVRNGVDADTTFLV